MKINIVIPHAGAAFRPGLPGVFGGAEVRGRHFAIGLARRGNAVRVVVTQPRAMPDFSADGVTVAVRPVLGGNRLTQAMDRTTVAVLADVSRMPHFPWLKVHRWQPRLLWQLPVAAANHLRTLRDRRRRTLLPDSWLSRLDGDVFAGFGVNHATEHAVASASRTGRPSVAFVASDHSLDHRVIYQNSHAQGPFGERGHLCWLILQEASAIVVQTEHQQRLLREHFGRDATLIRNPIDLGVMAEAWPQRSAKVLWIGRAEHFQKRPRLCYELARRCPEVPFLMILNAGVQEDRQTVVAEAPPNVEIIEQASFTDTERHFATAAVFVSTSAFEGFPNTFLQAAKYRVPILSLKVDPEGMLAQHGAGLCAGEDMAALADGLRRLWDDAGLRRHLGEAGRRYVEQYHDLEGRIDELESLLLSLTCRHASAGSAADT